MTKKKILIMSIVAGVVIIAIGIVVVVLISQQKSAEVTDGTPTQGQVTEGSTDLPPTNEKATALVDEAYAAQAEGDYAKGIQKLQEARAIYEQENIEMYVGDIDMQISIFEEQKAFHDKLEAQPQPALPGTTQ